MNEKEVKFNKEARKGLFEGITILAKAVMSTLGPNGRNVVLDNEFNGIHVTKDGVTVAEAIKLKNILHNMGCQLVKQAASKTNELAGDGTTTSTLLAYYIVKNGLDAIKNKANPIGVKRGMDKALKDIVALIEEKKIAIEGDVEKIRNIAAISGNNDPVIGDILAEAFQEIGDMNQVDIAENKLTDETFIDIVKGCQFNKGYISEYFCNNLDKKQVEFDNAYIVVYEGKPKNVRELGMHIENAGDSPIIFMVEDISNDILNAVVTEKLRRKLRFAIVKTPGFGRTKEDKLLDICASIGATLVTSKNTMSQITPNHYGRAEKVVIDKKGTIFVNGNGSKSRIQKRVDTLTERLETAPSVGERDVLKNRIAKLGAGVAVINVGANTPVELKEKKDRIIDALEATKAAIEEGVLPGGGTAYINIAASLEVPEDLNKNEREGYLIVQDSLYKPLQTIVENGGGVYKDVLKSVEAMPNFEQGYNAKNDTYGDMYKEGVIDPAKVARVALENAVSVAGMILITECALVDLEDIREDLPAFLQ